ncbi:MAG: AAA family ATPase [Alphaproteobacteria bacterium]|nr:AAA family ATPase [Alphaproteobacteria bacterium]
MECPRCSSGNAEDARYCGQCGVALGAAAAEALESERKPVTVLFADISGSTALISGLDPEHAWSLLDPVLQMMIEAVEAYGGSVIQIQGDGIVALIGAPLAQEDHALRACYAALRMHQMAERMPAAEPSAAPIRLHIGIATGDALVGTIGADLNRGYNAVGEVIHIAARLQTMAKPCQTLCTAETARQAAGFVQGRSLGMTSIRGVGQPVEVVELMGAVSAPVRFHATAMRGLSAFTDRERELRALRDALDGIAKGSGKAVALVGEAGVGKSRLVWELTHAPEAGSHQLLETGGTSYAANSPYHPIVALLRRHFEIDPLNGIEENRRSVSGRLAALGGDAERGAPAILALLGLDAGDSAWAAVDPAHRREAIERAVVRLVLRMADRAPLIFVVEDLHWVDRETHALIDRLIAQIDSAPVLLLVDYRPDHDPGWTNAGRLTRLDIEPLPAESARHFVDRMIGSDATVAELARDLVSRTAGNPFFLEQTVRSLVDARLLTGRPGAYRLQQPAAALQVPSSVRAVLGSRIDRFSALKKRLLQSAAVIGSSFAVTLLCSVLDGTPPDVVRAQLRGLAEASLIYESSLYPEPRFAFKHALTQEVAYEALPIVRRRAIHARIVAAIEALYPDRLFEHVESLAYHAAQGEVWDRLARYAREAGRRAAAQSAYRAAIRYFEDAILALERLPPSPATAAEAIATRFELRSALFPVGEIARDLAHLRQAEALARSLSDRRPLAWVSAYIARDLALLGEPDQALEASEAALVLANDVGDGDLIALTRASIGQAHCALGNYADSVAALRALVHDIAGGDPQRRFGLPLPGHVMFRCWLIWSLARLGGEADAEADEVMAALLKVARETDQPLSQTVALYSCGLALVHRGDLAGAIGYLEQALALCRRWDLFAWFTNIASCLGHAYAQGGRTAEGLDLLSQAVERSRKLGLMVSHAIEVAWHAEACIAAGLPEDAAAQAKAAVALARRHKERGNEAYALWLCAEIARRMPDVDRTEAMARLEEARALAGACGMRPLMARCDRTLAQLAAEKRATAARA